MIFLQWARLGPVFDKYLWECLYLLCEKDDDPPKLHKCEKCEKRPSLPRTLMAQAGTVCQYYSVALHKFFVHCHIFVDLCQITLGQALAHRSRRAFAAFVNLCAIPLKKLFLLKLFH
jgi:hypothetical protein